MGEVLLLSTRDRIIAAPPSGPLGRPKEHPVVTDEASLQRRVLILAPSGAEAPLIHGLLRDAGLDALICSGAEELASELRLGAGVAIVAEEALDEPAMAGITGVFTAQPEGSDVPLILLTSSGQETNALTGRLEEKANSCLSVVERPLRSRSLVAAVRVALQSRLRQLQVRGELTRRLRAERAVRETEGRSRRAQRAAGLGIWEFDFKTGRTIWSEEMWELFGLPPIPDVDPGETLWASLHPEDTEKVRGWMAACLDGEADQLHGEFRIVRSDGSTRWIESIAEVVRPSEAHSKRLAGVSIDITERKRADDRLRESEERFRLMTDSLPLMVWLHDNHGRQEFVNQTLCDYFGVDRSEMTGARWLSLVHPEDREAYLNAFKESLAHRRPFHREVRARRADGEWRWIESWGRPRFDTDGAMLGFIGTSADVTERKQTLEALRDADRRKDEFLATLAHELRNPLAAIRNGLEVLRLADDPATIGKICPTLERQATQLTRLVDDLLDVSRITHGRLELKPIRIGLQEVIRSAIDATRSLVDDAGHELTVIVPDEPIFLEADPLRLAQVLANILSNAARYTPPSGHIELRVEPEARGVHVSVRDDGLGIPPEKIESLFGMFEQIDHCATTGFHGLGIGLALAKSLVAMHGGRIEAQSEGPGKGSEFTIWLPVTPGPPAAERTSSPGHSLPEARVAHRVLIVEDNQGAARMLAQLIGVLGHDVRVAFDGLAGVRMAASFRPHLALMDIGLPRLNGYDAARRIRAAAADRQMILVALTGWAGEHDRQRALASGFDHHFIKPLEPATLISLLASVPQHEPLAAEPGTTSTREATEDSPAVQTMSSDVARDSRSSDSPHPPSPGPGETAGRRGVSRQLIHDLRGALNAMNLHLRIAEEEAGDSRSLGDHIRSAMDCVGKLSELLDGLDGLRRAGLPAEPRSRGSS